MTTTSFPRRRQNGNTNGPALREWRQDCIRSRCVLCGIIHPTTAPIECERWAHARLADLLGQHARDTGSADRMGAIRRGWRSEEISRLRRVLRARSGA